MPEPIIDYPWEEFLRDYHIFSALPEKSYESLQELIQGDSVSSRKNRSLLLDRVFLYISDNQNQLFQGNLGVEGIENNLLGDHVLKSLHYFLVRNNPSEWHALPPVSFLLSGENN